MTIGVEVQARSGLSIGGHRLSRVTLLEIAGVIALISIATLILVTKNSSFFNFWTDRDIVRSANLLNEFQYMAAELSYGAASRVPGGALHYLWFLPTMFSSDPNASYKFCIFLCLLAAVPFYFAMRAYFGAGAAIVATAVMLASPVTFSTMMRLWNPSFQVPFLFLAFAFLIHLVAGRQTWAFKWLIASLVVAMQMHVSTWLLMIALLPALLLVGPRVPWREVAWSVALTLLLLAPYLIGEVFTGWDNIKTMMASQGRGAMRRFDPATGILFNFDNARDIWAWFAMAFDMTDNLPAPPLHTALSWAHNTAFVLAALYIVLSIAHWLDWGKPIGRALGLELGGASGRLMVAAMAPVVLAFGYLSYSPQMELVVYGNSRYVMFAVPGLSILAGLAAYGVFSAIGRSAAGAALASIIVATMAALPLWSLAQSMLALDRPETPAGRQFMGAFNIVQKDRNWSMQDTITRMSVLRTHEAAADLWKFESIFAIGYELYRNGKNQPFARGGECVAYLTGGTAVYGSKGITLEALKRSFQQPELDLRLISQRAVGRDRLVVYERPGQPCFTTITNRYVFSPEENAMFKRYGQLKDATAEPTIATVAAGQSAWIINIGNVTYAMLKLSSEPGRLAVELHSNQLRGDTYNGGFLDAGMIENPRLRLEARGQHPILIDIQPGLVGGKGTFTPIRRVVDVPPGTYEVYFETGLYPSVPLGAWPVDFTRKTPVKMRIAADYLMPQ